MGRTKTVGIYRTEAGYDVDKHYQNQRLRLRGFETFKQAENWLVEEMERVRLEGITSQRAVRYFHEAAGYYVEKHQGKKSIESDVYHLKAVMPFIGDLPLERVHDGTLEPFITARKAQMVKVKIAKGKYELRPIKNKTVNLSLEKVRRILRLAAMTWRDDNGMTWLAQAPLITMLPLTDARPPRPIMWDEQRRLLPLLPDYLAEMALFNLNTGVRDDVMCNLQWDWEVPIPQLGSSIFVVPAAHVKGEAGKKSDRVLVCNSVAQSVVERQRGKHKIYVFVYRRERVKNLDREPVMPYRPIGTMNNTAWQTGRMKAGLGDLHVHDLRHTVGLRLREANVADRTIDDILWHANKSMTAHYSVAQIMEIFEALEKVKDESNRWNMSLQSLVREAAARNSTPGLPAKKQTG